MCNVGPGTIPTTPCLFQGIPGGVPFRSSLLGKNIFLFPTDFARNPRWIFILYQVTDTGDFTILGPHQPLAQGNRLDRECNKISLARERVRVPTEILGVFFFIPFSFSIIHLILSNLVKSWSAGPVKRLVDLISH